MKERIEELADKCWDMGDVDVGVSTEQIAEAITIAVNEALELAARECETNSPKPFTTGGIIERAQCAETIRRLKI